MTDASEQETVLQWERGEHSARVWTSDKPLMQRLNKLLKPTKKHKDGRRVWAAEYCLPLAELGKLATAFV